MLENHQPVPPIMEGHPDLKDYLNSQDSSKESESQDSALREVAATQEPRTEDINTPEWDKKFEGAELYKKSAEVDAIQATEETPVTTTLANGHVETTNTAKPGDWIVTNPGGERYVVAPDKFSDKYEALPDQPGRYGAKGAPVRAVQIEQDTDVMAPWGELQHMRAGDYLVDNAGDRYGIAQEEFNDTYAKAEEQSEAYKDSLENNNIFNKNTETDKPEDMVHAQAVAEKVLECAELGNTLRLHALISDPIFDQSELKSIYLNRVAEVMAKRALESVELGDMFTVRALVSDPIFNESELITEHLRNIASAIGKKALESAELGDLFSVRALIANPIFSGSEVKVWYLGHIASAIGKKALESAELGDLFSLRALIANPIFSEAENKTQYIESLIQIIQRKAKDSVSAGDRMKAKSYMDFVDLIKIN